jgi:hypothetical protein
MLAVAYVLSAYLCDPFARSAVYRLYGCHYRRATVLEVKQKLVEL